MEIKKHKWTLTDEGNGFYQVSNGEGGYLVPDYKIAFELLVKLVEEEDELLQTSISKGQDSTAPYSR